MSDVPVMQLGGGGDMIAECIRFWADTDTPAKCEELKATPRYDESGCQSGMWVEFDQSKYPNKKDMYIVAFVAVHSINSGGNCSTGIFIPNYRLYWPSGATTKSYILSESSKPGYSIQINNGGLLAVSQTGTMGTHYVDQSRIYLNFNGKIPLDTSTYRRYEIAIMRAFLIRTDWE